jgi:putative addiction module component (TIGR02574 family)
MTTTLQDLKIAASNLPVTDRAALAEFLLRSLDDGEDANVRTEWLALAERRMAEVKAGSVVGIPADEVLRSLPGSPR